ncbi:uncharacterized protein LOC144336058 [Macaca mulatta]
MQVLPRDALPRVYVVLETETPFCPTHSCSSNHRPDCPQARAPGWGHPAPLCVEEVVWSEAFVSFWSPVDIIGKLRVGAPAAEGWQSGRAVRRRTRPRSRGVQLDSTGWGTGPGSPRGVPSPASGVSPKVAPGPSWAMLWEAGGAGWPPPPFWNQCRRGPGSWAWGGDRMDGTGGSWAAAEPGESAAALPPEWIRQQWPREVWQS